MNLYWVTTPDGCENWFVFAKTKKLAEEFHENAEGYDLNDATAKKICKIPTVLYDKSDLLLEESGWPSHELLKKLGGKFDSEDNPRLINFFGKVYIEGTFTEKMFFNDIKISSGVYVIKVQNSSKYKIGRTINIKKRIKQFSTGNPFNIKLLYFIETINYKKLEKNLHNILKQFRIKGEWFNFEDNDLVELESAIAQYTEKSNENKLYNIKITSLHGRVY